MNIESPIDVVDDLAESFEHLISKSTDNKKILRIIAMERERIIRELAYLKSEEKKLSQQNASISLLESAIRPTKQRLEQIDSALETQLDKIFATLNSSQITLLRSLVTSNGIRISRPLKEWPLEYHSELNELSRLGLITISSYDVILMHDFIAYYIRKKYKD